MLLFFAKRIQRANKETGEKEHIEYVLAPAISLHCGCTCTSFYESNSTHCHVLMMSINHKGRVSCLLLVMTALLWNKEQRIVFEFWPLLLYPSKDFCMRHQHTVSFLCVSFRVHVLITSLPSLRPFYGVFIGNGPKVSACYLLYCETNVEGSQVSLTSIEWLEYSPITSTTASLQYSIISTATHAAKTKSNSRVVTGQDLAECSIIKKKIERFIFSWGLF